MSRFPPRSSAPARPATLTERHLHEPIYSPRPPPAPAVATLFLWMIVPLVMTIYFSVIRYNLMQPDQTGFMRAGEL